MARSSKKLPATLNLNDTLLTPGSRVCVAVSGGADSTALLLALHEDAATLGIGVSAVHLHHGIRGGEADADQIFVQELCSRLGLSLFLADANIPVAADTSGETLEEAARTARLRLFAKLVDEGTAETVATAHTSDDQAETVLMKLIRGAWTEGLAGISPVLYLNSDGSPSTKSTPRRVIRPLLNSTREEVERFLQSRNQGWREDSSNLSLTHTRNRIRHHLMPVLKSFNPSLNGTLATTAQLAREEEESWRPRIAALEDRLFSFGRPVRGGGRAVATSPDEFAVALQIQELRQLDLPTRRRLLRRAGERAGVSLNAQDVARLLQLIGLAPADQPLDPTVPSRPNTRIDLRNGRWAERSVRELRLCKG